MTSSFKAQLDGLLMHKVSLMSLNGESNYELVMGLKWEKNYSPQHGTRKFKFVL